MFLLMNGSSIFQARSTARRCPTYRGQTRKGRKAIEVLKVFHAEKSRKIISKKSQSSLLPYPAKNVTYYISASRKQRLSFQLLDIAQDRKEPDSGGRCQSDVDKGQRVQYCSPQFVDR